VCVCVGMCVCVFVSERKGEGMCVFFECVLGGGEQSVMAEGQGGERFSHVADSKTHACSHIHTHMTQM